MEMSKSILIVEDEADLADLLSFNLNREGYRCRTARDGAAALTEVRKEPPDLILLDRMLPKTSGDEVAAQIRRDGRSAEIPIIMLTAKAEESDELVGFALGADDYVTKPFSMKTVIARVAAVLRRGNRTGKPPDLLKAGPFAMDLERHELRVHDAPVTLTATEFRLLWTLMAADGRVLGRSQLIDAARGTDVVVTDRTIDVHITALRRKIGSAGGTDQAAWIQTVRGVGYTFRFPSS